MMTDNLLLNEHYKEVSYSWMENWYEPLKAYTMPTSYFKITKSEINQLLKLLKGTADMTILAPFIARFNTFHRELDDNKVFVRLGSRSPKDIHSFEKGVSKIQDLLKIFTKSMMISEDLKLCDKINYEPYIFIRKWCSIKKACEFRVFVKDGKLVGISQYNYLDTYCYLVKETTRDMIKKQTERLLEKILPKINFNTFICDIEFKPTNSLPLLIEINHYGPLSDPCLFNWEKDTFEEFEFRYLK